MANLLRMFGDVPKLLVAGDTTAEVPYRLCYKYSSHSTTGFRRICLILEEKGSTLRKCLYYCHEWVESTSNKKDHPGTAQTNHYDRIVFPQAYLAKTGIDDPQKECQ